MSLVKERTTTFNQHDERFYLDILSESEAGSWVIKLPPLLSKHQGELEHLLGKVFSGRPSSKENFALAQQMSLNWCFSKCKQYGKALMTAFLSPAIKTEFYSAGGGSAPSTTSGSTSGVTDITESSSPSCWMRTPVAMRPCALISSTL